MRFAAIVTLLSLPLVALRGQVQPPDFLCLRGDTLVWELPVNGCGPFISYDIYFSTSPNGPFTLYATVTDPMQTILPDPNPNNETRYYYLLSNYDCPGQVALPSDTLDNRPPEVSPIAFVSVENGVVALSWAPSPSPEVFAYIIYRRTLLGDVPVDTVYNGITYADLLAQPGDQSESYFVNALDRCGNTSLFDLRHRTIFLELTSQPCDRAIQLRWNPYQNWPDGVAAQRVWVSANGGAFLPDTSLAPADSSYLFTNVTDGGTYCFTVENTAANIGLVSRSNVACLQADIVRPMPAIAIEQASVNANGEVELIWSWDDDAEIKLVEVLRRADNSDFYEVVASQTPNLPLSPVSTFTDQPNTDAGRWHYRIHTTDECDSVVASTHGATIFLSGSVKGTGLNTLSWTPFDTENASVYAWDIYRIGNGSISRIATLNGGDTQFEDPYDPGLTGILSVCYYVVGKANLSLPNGMVKAVKGNSNTVCLSQPLRIWFPNAFAPSGFNQEFRPVIVPPEISSYDLRIFNRYGAEVFWSSDPSEAWRGRHKGKDLPQGVYVYTLHLTTTDGKTETRNGTVLLLR